MVKVVRADPPPEWIPLWEKIMRWFEIWGIPVFAGKWFQTSRKIKKAKRTSSKFSPMKTDWLGLSVSEKNAWRTAAYNATGYYRGYTYFTTNWIYRWGSGLSLPGSANVFHQLFGLRIKNSSGLLNVNSQIHDKDYTGEITLRFSFRKIENTASPTKAFKVVTTCYYFSAGGTSSDVDIYTCPSGSVSWNTITRTIGTTGRQYFHIVVSFELDEYDADVYLDNLTLRDAGGLRVRENWDTIKYKAWEPVALYRKEGWVFNPSYIEPYFKHLYLE